MEQFQGNFTLLPFLIWGHWIRLASSRPTRGWRGFRLPFLHTTHGFPWYLSVLHLLSGELLTKGCLWDGALSADFQLRLPSFPLCWSLQQLSSFLPVLFLLGVRSKEPKFESADGYSAEFGTKVLCQPLKPLSSQDRLSLKQLTTPISKYLFL